MSSSEPEMILLYAHQLSELATLMKYDKSFEEKFKESVKRGDEKQTEHLLAPLGIKNIRIVDSGDGQEPQPRAGDCEYCFYSHTLQKWVCWPICR